ncbi:ABC transporter permease [Streptomyces sp. NPDC006678]|uniref:ABC transporter permease n=1 Tax=Streptomyces sp. NPDC006678 TaxID=3157185 RepID=UPI0033FB1F0D
MAENTTLTYDRPSTGRGSRGIGLLKGPVRSVWLLHRRALLLFVAYLVLSAGSLVWLRFIAPGEELGPCGSLGSDLPPCGPPPLDSMFDFAGNLGAVAFAIAWLPLAVAFYAGAVLVGAELERGTAGLSWTQSVTPGRWLAAKLAVPAVLLLSGVTVLSLLYRWVRGAGAKALGDQWYFTDVFLALGPAVLAYCLFALAVGALAGLLVRRALPAGGLAFVVTAIVMLFADGRRDRLWPTADVVWRNSRGELPNSALQMENGLVVAGKRVERCWDPQVAMPPGCHSGSGIREWYAVFHPSSHFWPIQLVETGIVLALAAAATFAAFRVLRRLHA